jgi:hypothetical protein
MKYKTKAQLKKLKFIKWKDSIAYHPGLWWEIGPTEFGKKVPKDVARYIPEYFVQ